jgi:hypothetical protein
MSIRTVSVIEASEIPWIELPSALQAAFSKREAEAYNEGARFFKACAKRTHEERLVDLLSDLDDDHPMRVYVETYNLHSAKVWYGFTFLNRVRQPQFRLAKDRTTYGNLPSRLSFIFNEFIGIRSDKDDSGGLREPRIFDDQRRKAFREAFQRLKSTEHTEFFDFGNGDVVCWSDADGAILLDHESGQLLARNLDEFLDEYFV